jgi:hypothetical protein
VPENALSLDDVAILHRESEASSHSSALKRETSTSTNRTAPPPKAPLTTVSPPAASSFEDVRERRTYHSLVGLQGVAIQGYLSQRDCAEEPSEPVLVTVRRFGEALNENFISIFKAQELSLHIEELDPEDNGADKMVLLVRMGKRLVQNQAIGTVEVRWWTSHLPGIKVRMWVLDGALPDGTDIAFGKPFETRRRHYKRLSSVNRRN